MSSLDLSGKPRYTIDMIRILLLIWPAAIPLVLFLLWYAWAHRRAKKQPDAVAPIFKESPWKITLMSSVAIAIACLFVIVLSEEGVKGDYVPAVISEGTLQDGRITPK